MAYAYRQQTRFCPVIQTASVRFPQKIQSNVGCPAVNGCSLGAVTNVNIDSNAVVTLSSSYIMKGMDCFQFTVSNVICNGTYTFRSMSTSSYPTGASSSGQLCTVAVSPVVDTYICSTQQVVWTSIVPSAPFGVTTTTSNITWRAPITPENYGFPTITSYTFSNIGWILAPPALPPSTRIFSGLAISSNGQYQLAKQYTEGNSELCSTFMSTDYGTSWGPIADMPPIVERGGGIAVSATGQYMTTGYYDSTRIWPALNPQMVVYRSSNYGQTWNTSTYTPFNNVPVEIRGVCMSSNGQYQYFMNGLSTLGTSVDYGLNWTTQEVPFSFGTCVATSADGEYILAGSYTGAISSRSRGSPGSWLGIPAVSGLTSTVTGVAISPNGSYALISTRASDGGFGPANVYASSNANALTPTWTAITPSKITPVTGFGGCAISQLGQLQSVTDFAGNIYYSSNYGVDWVKTSLTVSTYINSLVVSSDARYSVISSYNVGRSLYTLTTQPKTVSISSIQINGTQLTLSLTNGGTNNTQIYASNMAGRSPWSRPG